MQSNIQKSQGPTWVLRPSNSDGRHDCPLQSSTPPAMIKRRGASSNRMMLLSMRMMHIKYACDMAHHDMSGLSRRPHAESWLATDASADPSRSSLGFQPAVRTGSNLAGCADDMLQQLSCRPRQAGREHLLQDGVQREEKGKGRS